MFERESVPPVIDGNGHANAQEAKAQGLSAATRVFVVL
jgi:hypothetical protein